MVGKPMKTPAIAGSNFRWVEGAQRGLSSREE